MNYYNEIRDILNKRFPDRLELKFGCEVQKSKQEYFSGITDKDIYTIYTTSGYKLHCLDCNMNVYHSYIKGEIAKILGTPPTLQEILRAIHFTAQTTTKDDKAIDSTGMFRDADSGGRLFQYDLTLPLQEQSEETLQSIYELIKKTNQQIL